jgi:uncharacterized protein YdaU (DUF1376 family)
MPQQPDRARFPYMPFFVDDWLSSDSVESFTLEQQGAYLLLLARQWKAKDGRLPLDEKTLARWSRLGPKWKALGKPIIARCFVERGGGLVNLRCRQLWESTREKSRKAQAAAEARWNREDDNGHG